MTVIERDLCMADPPAACSCGLCVLRSRLTNREVAAIEVERDRALDHLEGAVHFTEEERTRLRWWLTAPVAPGPMKALDEQILRKLDGGQS